MIAAASVRRRTSAIMGAFMNQPPLTPVKPPSPPHAAARRAGVWRAMLTASLSKRVVLSLALSFAVLTALLAAMAYSLQVHELRRDAMVTLEQGATSGAQQSAEWAQDAQRNNEVLRAQYLKRLDSVPVAEAKRNFEIWFTRYPDGLVRVRPELDDHTRLPSVYLRADLALTDELKHQTWVAFELLREWGPPLALRYYSVYIDLPAQGLIMFSPSVNWGQLADPSTNNTNYPPVAGSSPQANPTRVNRWTPVYFDDKAGIHMVSSVLPIDRAGRWLASVSHDVGVDQLMNSAVRSNPSGAQSVVISREGNLIAHPEFTQRLREAKGELSLAGLRDRLLNDVAAANPPPGGMALRARSTDGSHLIAVSNIDGPDWLYATVLPIQSLTDQALQTATAILAASAVLLLLLVLITSTVVRRGIGEPLADLHSAVLQLRDGEYVAKMPRAERPDELGDLARAFADLSHALRQRELGLQDSAARLRDQAAQTDKSERFIRAIANGLPGLVAYWGADQRCWFANNAYYDWFGVRPVDMIGLHVREFKNGPLYEMDERYMLGALAGVPQAFERTLTKANGEVGQFWTQYIPDTINDQVQGYFVLCSDITVLRRVEHTQQRVQLLLEASQAMAGVGGWEVDLRTREVYWTPEVYRIFETSPEEFTPTVDATRRFFAPSTLDRLQEIIRRAETEGVGHDEEFDMVTAKGKPIVVHSRGVITLEGGKPIKRTSVIQDITEAKRAQAALRESDARWKLALESTGDGVWDWNLVTGERRSSQRFVEMYGYGPQDMMELQGEKFDEMVHPDDVPQMLSARDAHLSGKRPSYRNEHRIRCKDGSWKWIMTRGMVIERDAQGKPTRMIGTHTDITERKQTEAMVWQQANFDFLTGLPNRSMLRDRLQQDLMTSRRHGLQVAVLFIDLDHFKEVNDTLGHDSGDVLLVDAALRIKSCVRESDTVARMGGDEFTVVLSELPDQNRVDGIAQHILARLSEAFLLGSERAFVSGSVGVALFPGDGEDIDTLFKHADQALYAAKNAGRNRVSYFTPALQELAHQRMRLAQDLRLALPEGQLRLAYQPIVHLLTGRVVKAEALLRWQHPVRGPISPAQFIPVAESSGQIVEMGEWVFMQAAAQVQAWREHLDPHFQVSINKSPVQFHSDAGRQKRWLEHLRQCGLAGPSLSIEITEGLLLDASDMVIEQLLALREAGVRVSLDDFGTGYSAMSYLQRYDIDEIKIDQSFVRGLQPQSKELALCKAMVGMAHELGMHVVAEGVETERQRDLLLQAGCDMAQGFWFARPMSPEDFEAFMRPDLPVR
jgi:diguanylate cyclase (GGDEF)-like protein/PAS domain S-box-containing protein